jgi:hypothetical protein
MGEAAQVPAHAVFVLPCIAFCPAQTVAAAAMATTITLDQRAVNFLSSFQID